MENDDDMIHSRVKRGSWAQSSVPYTSWRDVNISNKYERGRGQIHAPGA